jgi:valyl-tRNA synthetase
MAAAASDRVREGELRLLPAHHNQTWHRWLDNSQDWCVSRQLWWGHRIPAYRVIVEPGAGEGEETWVVAASEEEATEQAIVQYGLTRGSFSLAQDSDVLDTWFSSSLFPLTAFGWGSDEVCQESLDAFYPLSLMETGSDILFFWVARMEMMCTVLAGVPPFNTVYLHPVVRDAQGKKMSKSVGNVIDPLHIIDGRGGSELGNAETEAKKKKNNKKGKGGKQADDANIPQCGADALRCVWTVLEATRAQLSTTDTHAT